MLLNRNFPQELEVAEHFSSAQHHAGERIVSNGNRQAGFFANALVEVLQQCAAAGENDSAIADVSAQLRRGPLQGDAHRVPEAAAAFAKRFANLPVVDSLDLRHAFTTVAAVAF